MKIWKTKSQMTNQNINDKKGNIKTNSINFGFFFNFFLTTS